MSDQDPRLGPHRAYHESDDYLMLAAASCACSANVPACTAMAMRMPVNVSPMRAITMAMNPRCSTTLKSGAQFERPPSAA